MHMKKSPAPTRPDLTGCMSVDIHGFVRIISVVPAKGLLRLGVTSELDLKGDDKLSGP